ncbi:hypothetical protein MTZ49_10675 [Entomomonas sp. E2T0]|uniref:hypothetical protein n=1 Tax=Entomomonas sp. E2T0 TaxID=2930213 RepID=UPI0022283FB2|nr:hypothetical protein [Entomomonas sp. E2T0]UYZ83066.1 hypothetical protein MTZ49_10675 [Entomomonas sp. E2T0]
MTNQLYYTLCQFKGAHIAQSIYPFLADSGLIPDDEDTLELIFDACCSVNGKVTTNEIAAFMNVDQRERLKTYIECHLVQVENREVLRKALVYDEYTNVNNPSLDLFCIFFQGKGYGPTVENIEALCRAINEFEQML